MAEVRLTPFVPALTPATPGRTGEAVRAAQRAFFDAALNASQSPAPPRPVTSPEAAVAATAPARSAASPAPESSLPPGRGLRPGSLLDIRV